MRRALLVSITTALVLGAFHRPAEAIPPARYSEFRDLGTLNGVAPSAAYGASDGPSLRVVGVSADAGGPDVPVIFTPPPAPAVAPTLPSGYQDGRFNRVRGGTGAEAVGGFTDVSGIRTAFTWDIAGSAFTDLSTFLDPGLDSEAFGVNPVGEKCGHSGEKWVFWNRTNVPHMVVPWSKTPLPYTLCSEISLPGGGTYEDCVSLAPQNVVYQNMVCRGVAEAPETSLSPDFFATAGGVDSQVILPNGAWTTGSERRAAFCCDDLAYFKLPGTYAFALPGTVPGVTLLEPNSANQGDSDAFDIDFVQVWPTTGTGFYFVGGYADDLSGHRRPAYWQVIRGDPPSSAFHLGNPSTLATSTFPEGAIRALRVTDIAVAVGEVSNAATSRAVFWNITRRTVFDLNSVAYLPLEMPSGWILLTANDINASGVVVGSALNTTTGETHAYALIP